MAGNTILEDQIILEWISKPESLEKGFRALVEKFQQKLYWHIRRMVLSHDDADDVLQNTFIKVYRSIEQFEQKAVCLPGYTESLRMKV